MSAFTDRVLATIPGASRTYAVAREHAATADDVAFILGTSSAAATRALRTLVASGAVVVVPLDGLTVDGYRVVEPCVVCGAPSTDEVADINHGGPWIAVCSDECGDVATTHADDCDCDDCADDDGAVVTDDDEVASVLAADADANVIDTIQTADGVQHASIVGGERDGAVYVVTSNTHGQSLVFVFRTLDGARTYYDAVTADFDTEGL
jgi:hypothetical protein